MVKEAKRVQEIFDEIISKKNKVITEESAKEILTEYGIKVPTYALVKTESEAVEKAKQIGFPLVAKIVSPEILHKTDVKGVKVGLASEAEVRETFVDMHGRLSNQYETKGILLEKMVPPGIELIVGLQNDPQFGPVIMVGVGGINTEIFNNPVIAYPHDYYVVDAKIILKEEPRSEAISKSQPDSSYMDVFFNAGSIALIGASPEQGKVGNSVFESLVKHEYKGKVFPVNAKGYPEIMGIKAYKSLEDIDEPVEVVVVTVDLRFVPDLLKSCGKKNIHNMVIISGGGKELGGERAAIEQQIKELSSQLKVRIIGPNCIGMFNGENRLDCAFQGHERMLRPQNGHVAFLSQSGTVGIAFMETADAFGMSKMISYGNRSDVDEADMIWYLSKDPQTKVIGLYVEGLGDGRKFMNTAKKVIHEAKKPVVVFKNGRTTRGAKQALSHTGSLGGSYAVVKGALDQAGIISVNSYEELTGSLKALIWQPVPNGSRVAMVTNGAGPVIAAIDHFEELGLVVAEISEASKRAFKEHYPPTYVVGNPCDITGSASADDYRFAIQTFIDDPNVDIIMPWFVFQDDPLEETIIDVLAEFQKQKKKPILVGAMGGPFTQKISDQIEDHNVPVYHSVTSWVSAAGSLAKWSKVLAGTQP